MLGRANNGHPREQVPVVQSGRGARTLNHTLWLGVYEPGPGHHHLRKATVDNLTWRILNVVDDAVRDPNNDRKSTWSWAKRFQLANDITKEVHRELARRRRLSRVESTNVRELRGTKD